MKIILISCILLPLLIGCDNKESNTTSKPTKTFKVEKFNVKFKFGGKEVMNEFEKAFIKNNIPYKLNQDGTISYRSSDREKVQVFGDKIVNQYLKNKK